MAILLALAFVAARAWYKHEDPIVIGNLSKEDVSQISRVALRRARVEVIDDLKDGVIKPDLMRYHWIRVLSIEKKEPEFAVATTGMQTNDLYSIIYFSKTSGEWKVTGSIHVAPINTAPIR